MAAGITRARRPRSGRRRLTRVLVGIALMAAGLLVFRYASEISTQVGAYVAPPPEGDTTTGSGFTQAGYLPFVVWGFGFTPIGIGATMLRAAFMSSIMGSMGGSPMEGVAGMSPDAMNAYMQQAFSGTQGTAARAMAAPDTAKEIVKIKCRNCGSLEAEDAAFCRKCGKPL